MSASPLQESGRGGGGGGGGGVVTAGVGAGAVAAAGGVSALPPHDVSVAARTSAAATNGMERLEKDTVPPILVKESAQNNSQG
jgi:hypothetical protein